jgi:hypothetical protein
MYIQKRGKGQGFIFFKGLAHTVMEIGKSKVCRRASSLETQGRVDVAVLGTKHFFEGLRLSLKTSLGKIHPHYRGESCC